MTAIYSAYVICTSPRSGSTLLCDQLRATGVAGNPSSLFYAPELDDWVERLNVTAPPDMPERDRMAAILAAALPEGRGGTGIFGLRQQRHSFAFLCEKLASLFPQATDEADLFRLAFGATLFIHLSRPDKVAQAVSLEMARQTGLWHAAPDGTEIERLSPHRPPVYDGPALRARVHTLCDWDRDWHAWFAQQGIAPLHLTYDDLSADPQAVLRRVLGALGLDPAAADGVRPGLRKLADATSAAWAERLHAELAA